MLRVSGAPLPTIFNDKGQPSGNRSFEVFQIRRAHNTFEFTPRLNRTPAFSSAGVSSGRVFDGWNSLVFWGEVILPFYSSALLARCSLVLRLWHCRTLYPASVSEFVWLRPDLVSCIPTQLHVFWIHECEMSEFVLVEQCKMCTSIVLALGLSSCIAPGNADTRRTK